MKDIELRNSKELTTAEKPPLFKELTSAEAEVTKGGMFCSQGHSRPMPRSYLRIALFFLSSLFGFYNFQPKEPKIIHIDGDLVVNANNLDNSSLEINVG